MAFPHIQGVRLLPPGVPAYCNACQKHDATLWLCDNQGDAIMGVCKKHGVDTISSYRQVGILGWTLHPIHHTDPSDRTSHPRPPICGHSACCQTFIDTGNNACIVCQNCETPFVDRGGPSLECECGKKVQP